MIKKHGKHLVNARVKVDYRGDKPRISFSYPDKNSQHVGSMYFEVKSICLIAAFFTVIISPIKNVPLVWKPLIPLLYVYFSYSLLSLIVYFPFKKQWNSLYPKWRAFAVRKKVMIFKPKNIKENYFEVPYFENVLLDYKTTGEFASNLDFIEIKEYPFKYFSLRDKRKRKVNEWIWYARFYYSKKPKIGKLEVIFK